jgi:hypothetical protein
MSKDRDNFHRLMNELSTEAEELQVEEARLLALDALREKRKQQLIMVLVVALYIIVYFKYAEIRDTVASLFRSNEPEYQSILAVNEELDSEKPGAANGIVDTTSRKGRLKEAMRRAKDHAAVVDQIMDDNLNASTSGTTTNGRPKAKVR